MNEKVDNLKEIRTKLLAPSGYIIVPVRFINEPLLLPEWEIQDEELDGTGEHYSILSLHKIFGSLIKPKYVIDGKFVMFRYGIDWDTVDNIAAYLTAVGLTDARPKDEKGRIPAAKEVDYTMLSEDAFMIIPQHMGIDIPTTLPKDEDEVTEG